MRIYFDCEFYENAGHVQMISVALVREDGAELLCENAAFDWNQPMADLWLHENVLPYLNGPGKPTWMTPKEIARALSDFCGDQPEFWAYNASYDWVCLMSVFGRLVDRPKHWPSGVRDLKWEMDLRGLKKKDLPAQDPSTLHDPLADARWNKLIHEFVVARPIDVV